MFNVLLYLGNNFAVSIFVFKNFYFLILLSYVKSVTTSYLSHTIEFKSMFLGSPVLA